MHFRLTQFAPLPARKRHFVYNIKTCIGSHVGGENVPRIFMERDCKIIECNMDVARVHNGEIFLIKHFIGARIHMHLASK